MPGELRNEADGLVREITLEGLPDSAPMDDEYLLILILFSSSLFLFFIWISLCFMFFFFCFLFLRLKCSSLTQDRYARAGILDPKVFVTTSRDPSPKLVQLAKVFFLLCFLKFHNPPFFNFVIIYSHLKQGNLTDDTKRLQIEPW